MKKILFPLLFMAGLSVSVFAQDTSAAPLYPAPGKT